MKWVKALLSSLLLASGLLSSLAASADPIVVSDNITNLTNATFNLTNLNWAAQAFTTPNVHFQNMTISTSMTNSGPATGKFEAYIYTSNGSGPRFC